MTDFYAISPNGDNYISNNCTRFAKENGLIPAVVCNCVKNNSHYKGWYFYRENPMFKFDYSKIDLKDKRY